MRIVKLIESKKNVSNYLGVHEEAYVISCDKYEVRSLLPKLSKPCKYNIRKKSMKDIFALQKKPYYFLVSIKSDEIMFMFSPEIFYFSDYINTSYDIETLENLKLLKLTDIKETTVHFEKEKFINSNIVVDNDKEELAIKMIEDKFTDFISLPKELQDSRSFVIKAVSANPNVVSLLPKKYRDDEEIIKLALSDFHTYNIVYASRRLKNDEKFLNEVLNEYGRYKSGKEGLKIIEEKAKGIRGNFF